MNVITRNGDFNRDGHADVIARESAASALWLYRGTWARHLPGSRTQDRGRLERHA